MTDLSRYTMSALNFRRITLISHCRGTVRPFPLPFRTEEQIQREKNKWKTWKPTDDPRSKRAKKQYERDQEKRRQANAEKQQYERWKALLGNDAPKTIGAFRRMKRGNTKRFQQLESMYRSAAIKAEGE